MELFSVVASTFPDLYNGWTSSLAPDVQQKLKEVLGWLNHLFPDKLMGWPFCYSLDVGESKWDNYNGPMFFDKE